MTARSSIDSSLIRLDTSAYGAPAHGGRPLGSDPA
jgi:hypothetical protein